MAIVYHIKVFKKIIVVRCFEDTTVEIIKQKYEKDNYPHAFSIFMENELYFENLEYYKIFRTNSSGEVVSSIDDIKYINCISKLGKS